jgi:hypothetical protein
MRRQSTRGAIVHDHRGVSEPSIAIDIVLIAQVLASTAMAGLIWTIQLVHYPLMGAVPGPEFVSYESEHRRRITWIVGPLMAVEGICVLILLVAAPSSMAWWLPWSGAIAEAVAIGTTAFISAPLHVRLSAGRDDELLDRLITTNWIRTAAWTTRAGLSVAMLLVV